MSERKSPSDAVRAWRVAAGLLAAAAAAGGACSAPGGGGPADPAPAAVEEFPFAPGYAGSDACASCHAKEYREWKDSLHSRMEQAAVPGTVLGDFTPAGTVLAAEAPGRRLVMIREGDRFFIEAPDAGGVPRRYAIDRTVGNRYKQRYLARFPDGSWRALPVQWFAKDAEFVEWNRLASGEPGTGRFWTDDAWQWQLKCAGCHTTGLSLGYDPATRTYDTRWRELAIGCESCHGPGAGHARAGGGKDNILCPSTMPVKQQIETCGKCHSRGTAGPEQGAPPGLPGRLAYPYDMLPGARLDDHYGQAAPEDHPEDFWKDGSSLNHHQQLTDYRKSWMLQHGGEDAPHCTTCHEPHAAAALKVRVEDNSLCLQCHEALRPPAALAEHTGHGPDPAANAGARCVECHMPRIVAHAGSEKLRSHTYWGPNPRRSAETGAPDACLLCHADRDAAWSRESAERIWPGLSGRE